MSTASTTQNSNPTSSKAGRLANQSRANAVNSFKLGRLARSHDPRIPQLQALLAGKFLPTPSVQVDYTRNMPSNLGVMGNDTLGDCTCAAFYHARQVWNYNAPKSRATTPPTNGRATTAAAALATAATTTPTAAPTAVLIDEPAAVVELYQQACGYNPSQAGEGPGGNEQQVLTYLLNKGAPIGPNGAERQRLSGFVELDVSNINSIKSTIQDCGVAYIGFNVPQFIIPPGNAPLPVWDVDAAADNTIIGGHAVVLAGYNSTGARVISWGQYYTMTWAFFERFVDEAYALIDADWVASTGRDPAGLSMQQLTQAMQALRQN